MVRPSGHYSLGMVMPASAKPRQPKSPLSPPLAPHGVLLAGFDAFGGFTQNPSGLATAALHGEMIAGHRVMALLLPTVFGQSLEMLLKAVAAERPALVIATGMAQGRGAVSIERVAINLCDATLPDNAGVQAQGSPVVAGAPAAYFSNLPIKSIALAVQRAGIPAEISLSAGSYVCNHVFYGLLHALTRRRSLHGIQGGFIHLPCLPEQAASAQPSLALAEQVRALRIAVQVCVNEEPPSAP
jgi:pyroglutamyl-peptidase